MTGRPADRLDRIEEAANGYLRAARRIYGSSADGFQAGAFMVEDVLALVAVARAARERRCNRFDVSPCSERPEINPEDWCSMCAALARLEEA